MNRCSVWFLITDLESQTCWKNLGQGSECDPPVNPKGRSNGRQWRTGCVSSRLVSSQVSRCNCASVQWSMSEKLLVWSVTLSSTNTPQVWFVCTPTQLSFLQNNPEAKLLQRPVENMDILNATSSCSLPLRYTKSLNMSVFNFPLKNWKSVSPWGKKLIRKSKANCWIKYSVNIRDACSNQWSQSQSGF